MPSSSTSARPAAHSSRPRCGETGYLGPRCARVRPGVRGDPPAALLVPRLLYSDPGWPPWLVSAVSLRSRRARARACALGGFRSRARGDPRGGESLAQGRCRDEGSVAIAFALGPRCTSVPTLAVRPVHRRAPHSSRGRCRHRPRTRRSASGSDDGPGADKRSVCGCASYGRARVAGIRLHLRPTVADRRRAAAADGKTSGVHPAAPSGPQTQGGLHARLHQPQGPR